MPLSFRLGANRDAANAYYCFPFRADRFGSERERTVYHAAAFTFLKPAGLRETSVYLC